jgi:hypothetical protein
MLEGRGSVDFEEESRDSVHWQCRGVGDGCVIELSSQETFTAAVFCPNQQDSERLWNGVIETLRISNNVVPSTPSCAPWLFVEDPKLLLRAHEDDEMVGLLYVLFCIVYAWWEIIHGEWQVVQVSDISTLKKDLRKTKQRLHTLTLQHEEASDELLRLKGRLVGLEQDNRSLLKRIEGSSETVKDIEIRTLNKELHNAHEVIAATSAVSETSCHAQKEAEGRLDDYERRIKYLERLLRKNGTPFNPIMGHGEHHGEAA